MFSANVRRGQLAFIHLKRRTSIVVHRASPASTVMVSPRTSLETKRLPTRARIRSIPPRTCLMVTINVGQIGRKSSPQAGRHTKCGRPCLYWAGAAALRQQREPSRPGHQQTGQPTRARVTGRDGMVLDALPAPTVHSRAASTRAPRTRDQTGGPGASRSGKPLPAPLLPVSRQLSMCRSQWPGHRQFQVVVSP